MLIYYAILRSLKTMFFWRMLRVSIGKWAFIAFCAGNNENTLNAKVGFAHNPRRLGEARFPSPYARCAALVAQSPK